MKDTCEVCGGRANPSDPHELTIKVDSMYWELESRHTRVICDQCAAHLRDHGGVVVLNPTAGSLEQASRERSRRAIDDDLRRAARSW